MIKEIFLPEKLFGSRLLSKRIVGFSLEENHVQMTQVYATSRHTTVELALRMPLEEEAGAKHENRAQRAIAKLFSRVGKYDHVRISMPASLVVFKELTMPFNDPDKIRMVLEYEIEPALPFPIDEAIFDFIVTSQSKGGKDETTQIIAAAVRAPDLQEALDVYKKAGIEPTHITIDILGLYNLYQQIPEYNAIKAGASLIDVGPVSTKITFMQDGMLRMIRAIPKGFLSLTEQIAAELKISPDDVQKRLQEVGSADSQDEAYTQVAQKHLFNFFNDIQFTLNSFTQKLNFTGAINKILFAGGTGAIHDLAQQATEILQTPCEIFETKKIFTNETIKYKKMPSDIDWGSYTRALGTAMPSTTDQEFDLRRKAFTLTKVNLVSKQIITAGALLATLLISIGVGGYFHLHALAVQTKYFEEKEVAKLKRVIDKGRRDGINPAIENLMKRAKRDSRLSTLVRTIGTLKEAEENTWLSLVKRKLSPLPILLEATKMIDRKNFAVSINNTSLFLEDEAPHIEIEGILKPRRLGEDWKEWARFEQSLTDKDRKTLPLKLVDSSPEQSDAPDGGVKFTITLRKRAAEIG